MPGIRPLTRPGSRPRTRPVTRRPTGLPARPASGRARVFALVLALLAVQLASLAAPAHACGCGAMVTSGQRHVSVDRETSVVRWDGREEQIVMSLTVGGDAERAAWIMPVPHRADVRLGDAGLFGTLADVTAPVYRDRFHFWPDDLWPFDDQADGAAAAPRTGAPAGVGVVDRQRLGPFDVARLTANDPDALETWLHDNGFSLPARLDSALKPYVEQEWEYVAVRLAPEGGAALSGTLDPLHLTFASDAPVYPMRLSRLAATPQSLRLYVLSAHRVRPESTIGGEAPRVAFAGNVASRAAGLGGLADGTPYLTAIDQEFPSPSRISGDHTLLRAANDAPYREVIHRDRLMKVAGLPVYVLVLGGGFALVVVGVVLGLLWWIRRRLRRADAKRGIRGMHTQPFRTGRDTTGQERQGP
ncbi:MAG TPA: DUF2330 domain-containing protein [Streptomyces sp.]|nr:DUF2330 domain-containing protein [Streptomyces sp.]